MVATLRRTGLAVVLAAAAAGTLSPAATAEPIQVMASSSCTVGTSGNCTTAVVGANASGHFIDVFINNRARPTACPWRLRDVNAGIVASGTTSAFSSTSRRIGGLYGYYQLELRGCTISARGFIDNE